ncbi:MULTISPECIES: lysis system o-spanin lipoprotein Rz1 [Symbiopectobacterium]|uniref:lysis system o-spanin lipoprotein Rz1 n=1 Tax=Symbiopectobacterium TaxID=801 RepID=UPI00345C4170
MIRNLLPSLSAMWLLVVAGCTSKQPVPMCPPIPPPPPWMMQPAPDLQTPLNEIISLSYGESK